MSEEKSEASKDVPEQLGPYRIEEQVPQDTHAPGEVYRAIHETSGAVALVFKPSAEDGAAPLTDWRVRCISSSTPSYLAMEVEHTPWSGPPDRHSVESLVCTFEEVHEGVRRMAHVVPDTRESPPWRQGPALAGVTVCALVFAVLRLFPEAQRPSDPANMASAAPALVSHAVPMTAELPDPFSNGWLADSMAQGQPVFARPLPSEPFKGQKRPPCTRYVQVEINGACWAPHKLKAPCPDDLYEYKGECYLPIFAAKPPPQSLGQ